VTSVPPGPARLILATDLDGTMTHGEPRLRASLVAWLRTLPGSALVYVTGRSLDAVLALAERTVLPVPDVLIADVGTSVLEGFGPVRMDRIEAALGRDWPGSGAVRDRLADLTELTLQDVQAPRRVSYWVAPVRALRGESADPFRAAAPDDASLGAAATALATHAHERAAARLADLDVDVLLSGNAFVDVLPRGVNKGSTLRRVLRWLSAPSETCVVAGDSLNDLALFETGCLGIVVGNCEPELRRRVQGMGHVYQAEHAGVAGVIEGLRHHGIDPDLTTEDAHE
jgi:hydroxymethylpyrimidine pyrophosphatase-like HAD family hydrolase